MTDTATEQRTATETWLDELHIPWTFVDALNLDDIDKAASLQNQARLEPLDPDVVDRYQADMERGHTFPPIIVTRRSPRSKKVVILGGNHRHAAAVGAGLDTLPAYLVTDVEGAAVTRLTYEDNRRHGLPPTDEERIHQAIHLMDQGWTQTDAAECVGISTGRLIFARRTIDGDRRARRLSVDTAWFALGKTARARIATLRSDPVFEAVANLAITYQLPMSVLERVVVDVNKTSSEAAALAVVGAAEEAAEAHARDSAGGKTKKHRRTAVERLDAVLLEISQIEPAEVAAQITATGKNPRRARIKTAAQRLMTIDKALQ